jgi:hypothetical protein
MESGEADAPSLEPVIEAVPGAEHQPHMWRAGEGLHEARKQLLAAKHDKGNYRIQARIQAPSLIQQAGPLLRS